MKRVLFIILSIILASCSTEFFEKKVDQLAGKTLGGNASEESDDSGAAAAAGSAADALGQVSTAISSSVSTSTEIAATTTTSVISSDASTSQAQSQNTPKPSQSQTQSISQTQTQSSTQVTVSTTTPTPTPTATTIKAFCSLPSGEHFPDSQSVYVFRYQISQLCQEFRYVNCSNGSWSISFVNYPYLSCQVDGSMPPNWHNYARSFVNFGPIDFDTYCTSLNNKDYTGARQDVTGQWYCVSPTFGNVWISGAEYRTACSQQYSSNKPFGAMMLAGSSSPICFTQ